LAGRANVTTNDELNIGCTKSAAGCLLSVLFLIALTILLIIWIAIIVAGILTFKEALTNPNAFKAALTNPLTFTVGSLTS
jgi:hypothetical protein